jgi:hypothetical protein
MKTILDEIIYRSIASGNNILTVEDERRELADNPISKISPIPRYSVMDEVLLESECSNRLPIVHLISSAPVSRSINRRQGSQLNEEGQPEIRDPESYHSSSARSLIEIVEWLNVEQSARYQRTTSKTFCNVYAYDYCTFAGAYLPRVWWNQAAIRKLKKCEEVEVEYVVANNPNCTKGTVCEINANRIFDWLRDRGATYWWEEVWPNGNDFSAIQNHANNGDVVVLVQKNTRGSGHVLVVIPESEKGRAKRENGIVTLPVHSQAGSTNFSYSDHDHKSPRNINSLFQRVVRRDPNVKIYMVKINAPQ